jgi:twitching motility protein PilT
MVEDLPDTIRVLHDVLGTGAFEIQLIAAPQVDTLYRRWYEHEQVDELPPVESLHELLDETVRRRASDLHLAIGRSPAVRVDGVLIPLAKQPLTKSWLHQEMENLAGPERLVTWETTNDVDFSYTYGEARFRVNLGADRFGLTVAARKIPTAIPSMDELGLPEPIQTLTSLERGLVLVVGPTGSGKSTTLASMLAEIVQKQSRHVITLEDPIEFLLPAGRSVVNQRELGWSFSSFPSGLRQALRQDPDVILVGEMRDLDTIRTAITAAETGHLVFATLHTFDAPATVARIVSSFPSEEQEQVRAQLAYTLQAVLAQTLLPRANKKGRIAAFEVMLSTPAIANNLRRIDGHNRLRQSIETSVQDGMNTMTMYLVDLVRKGLVRLEDAEFRAPDREDFSRRIEAEHL